MFQTFDSQQQRHLLDEKATHLEPANLAKKNTLPALKKRSISSVASEPGALCSVRVHLSGLLCGLYVQ